MESGAVMRMKRVTSITLVNLNTPALLNFTSLLIFNSFQSCQFQPVITFSSKFKYRSCMEFTSLLIFLLACEYLFNIPYLTSSKLQNACKNHYNYHLCPLRLQVDTLCVVIHGSILIVSKFSVGLTQDSEKRDDGKNSRYVNIAEPVKVGSVSPVYKACICLKNYEIARIKSIFLSCHSGTCSYVFS